MGLVEAVEPLCVPAEAAPVTSMASAAPAASVLIIMGFSPELARPH